MGRPRKHPRPRSAILVAKTSGVWTDSKGVDHWAHAGKTLISDDHDFARATPDWWEPVSSDFPEVEQATAAPGELRGEDEED